MLLLDEPTHGIDVGTKSQVHQRISELAAEGYPVVLISSDLPEVLAMSDRILVVAGGTGSWRSCPPTWPPRRR